MGRRIIVALVQRTKDVGLVILMAMMFLTIIDVFGRKFLQAPVTGSYEVTELMLATFVFFSIGYTQLKKGHIAIEAAYTKLPLKARICLDRIVYLISIGLTLIMTWQLLMHAKRLYLGKTVTGVLHIPIYPFFILAAFGTFIFFLALFLDLVESFKRVDR
ncbi:MAG: TRAP transporter small permease [Desulfobacterota bacterium]|nr:TRAP transporter small permease [Thermodesulfobacteriota bacterium]MDW8001773.1 TRAP transporter small permease [Deltaproteobacteria bacterium]